MLTGSPQPQATSPHTGSPAHRGLRRITWEDWRSDPELRSFPLLDVRSPGEFAQGGVPGALNCPLFTDEGRHQVGLTYKTEGVKAAVTLGLELFAARAAEWLADLETRGDRNGPARPVLIHCWRGGMRSQSLATWLAAAGRPVFLLAGGYKEYRRGVLAALDRLAATPLVVLDGRTGVGKSALLRELAGSAPLLDFEGLARHRGSAFGDFAQVEPCPTQQGFENQLAESFLALGNPSRVLVEIETVIGPVHLPQRLRDAVQSAPTILLEREFDDRVARLAAEYARGWSPASDRLFAERCRLLERHVSRADLDRIIAAVHNRDFHTATVLLLELRYDKIYDKGIRKRSGNIVATFNLTTSAPAAVAYIRDLLAARSMPPPLAPERAKPVPAGVTRPPVRSESILSL